MPGAKAVTAGEERALLERNDSATSSVDDDVNAASDEQTPSPDNATKESDVTINCADETIDVSDKSANTDEDELRDEDTNGVSICPAAACLVQRFGCRMVALCGGVIASLGFSCAAYCPNIESFIFFYGVVSGVGAGLVYLPCITMSNLYFDRKRGAVAGIFASGSGVGLLVLAQTGNDDGYKETDTSSSSSSTESTISDEPGFTNCDRPGAALTFVTRHRGFVLFLAGAFLVQLVSQVPSLFTPSYAYLHGVGNEQVAQIISVFGAGPPLQAVILVEYLGVERLASVFGFLGFVKAFACLAGAPLAGLVVMVRE
nr:hypothetical protein BaRGS_035151 [Batillaria attramentaria]